MRIYIHSGMHKTGTTSFQDFLRDNAPWLESCGYRAFVNPQQIFAKCPESFNPDWVKTQVNAARQQQLTALIFSMEAISTFSSMQLNNLINAFASCEVTFLVTFRHWTSFLPSRWAQNCARRDTQSLRLYFSRLLRHQNQHIEARFDLVIRNFLSTRCDEIKIISYENAIRSSGLVSTLLRACDLPDQAWDTPVLSKYWSNRRASMLKCEVARLFNGVYSLQNHREPNEQFRSVLRAIPIEEHYDFGPLIDRSFHADPFLHAKINELVREHRKVFHISRRSGPVLAWEEALEDTARGMIVNSCNGRLFRDLPDVEIPYADIEADQIEPILRESMVMALEN